MPGIGTCARAKSDASDVPVWLALLRGESSRRVMGSASGRQLTEEAEVRRRWRPGRIAVPLMARGVRVAVIESRWVTSDLSGATKVRNTMVEFADGARWSITTEPPNEAPEPRRTMFGSNRPGRHSVDDRVVTVRDEWGRTLAIASWPETQPDEGGTENDSSGWSEAKDAVVSAARASTRELRRRPPHRRGRVKWLVLGAALWWLALGSLPAAIAGITMGEPGLTIAFGITFVASVLIGLRSLRHWRDASFCWSCANPVTGNPASCPFCDASRPRSAGIAPRMLGTTTSGQFVGTIIDGISDKFASAFPTRSPMLTVGDETYRLVPLESPERLASSYRLGEIMTINSHVNAVTLVPERPMPMEAALLCWHIVKGDYRAPHD